MGLQLPTNKESNRLFDSDEEAQFVLKREAKILKTCAIIIWKKYLASYQPKEYAVHKTGAKGMRTGASLNSIQMGEPKKVGDNDWQVEVTFRDDLAYHESVINSKGGKKHKDGHAIMLISFGWRVKKGSHRNIKHFGYRQGYDYLGKVNRLYKKLQKDKRVSLEIQWAGKKNFLG